MNPPSTTNATSSGQRTLDSFGRSPLCDAHISSVAWSGSIPTLYFTGNRDGLNLRSLVGTRLTVEVSEERICTSCGSETDRSPCSECWGKPPHAQCIFSPGNACTYQDCPFPDYREEACSHDFEVYLAAKDCVKVGITRAGRRENRLRGQGATHALVIARAKNRKLAGIIEKCCAEAVEDRAPKGWFEPLDEPSEALVETVRECEEQIPDRLRSCCTTIASSADALRDRVFALEYPGCRRFDDSTGTSLQSLQVGEKRTGTLAAVRGKTLATDTFTFEAGNHAGRNIMISLSDDGN